MSRITDEIKRYIYNAPCFLRWGGDLEMISSSKYNAFPIVFRILKREGIGCMISLILALIASQALIIQYAKELFFLFYSETSYEEKLKTGLISNLLYNNQRVHTD